MTKDLAEWIVKAIETIKSGVADKIVITGVIGGNNNADLFKR